MMEWIKSDYSKIVAKISPEENNLRMEIISRVDRFDTTTESSEIMQLYNDLHTAREQGSLSAHSFNSCCDRFYLVLGQLHLSKSISRYFDDYRDQSRELISLLFEHYHEHDIQPSNEQFYDDVEQYLRKVGTAYSLRPMQGIQAARRLN